MKLSAWTAQKTVNTDGGFTVLEVTLVGLLVAIALAIALPVGYKALRAYEANSSAMQVAESLSAARSLAMARNSDITLLFKANNGTFGYDFNGDGTIDTQDPANPSLSYPVQQLSGGSYISFPGSNDITVTFNSRGELPIGTVIPSGQQGLKVQVFAVGGPSATVWINIRGKVWVTTP